MKLCNADPFELIKNCKYGPFKKSEMQCKCTKDCVQCEVGGTSGVIKMHPELYIQPTEDDFIKAAETTLKTARVRAAKQKALHRQRAK